MSTERRTIVLASRNQDKLRELRQICADLPFEVVSSLDYPGLPEVIEDGTTALGNATRKALVTAAWTGEIAVADDTTFQVRTLGGMPDVFASRFAGKSATYADNVSLVLDLMADVPDDGRDVRFETSMVWVDPSPKGKLVIGRAAPAQTRWVYDPFAVRLVADPQLVDRLRDEQRREWAQYRAWFGDLPVGWGADRERLEAMVAELVDPMLAGVGPGLAPAGEIRLPAGELWTADGPNDRRAPAYTVPLGGEAPGRASCEPVWLELSSEGRMLGQLTRQPLGTRGFGYDPIVVPTGYHRTLAELSPDEKNAISHRGRALRRLMEAAARVYGEAPSPVKTG